MLSGVPRRTEPLLVRPPQRGRKSKPNTPGVLAAAVLCCLVGLEEGFTPPEPLADFMAPLLLTTAPLVEESAAPFLPEGAAAPNWATFALLAALLASGILLLRELGLAGSGKEETSPQ